MKKKNYSNICEFRTELDNFSHGHPSRNKIFKAIAPYKTSNDMFTIPHYESFTSTHAKLNKEYLDQKEENKNFQRLYSNFQSHSKKSKFKSQVEDIFKDIIEEYKERGYKIPNFSVRNNLFKPSPLLLENHKLIDYFKYHGEEESKYVKDENYLDNMYKIVAEKNSQLSSKNYQKKLSLINWKKLSPKNNKSAFDVMQENKIIEMEKEAHSMLNINKELRNFIEEKSQSLEKKNFKISNKIKKLKQEEKWKNSKDNLMRNITTVSSKMSRNKLIDKQESLHDTKKEFCLTFNKDSHKSNNSERFFGTDGKLFRKREKNLSTHKLSTKDCDINKIKFSKIDLDKQKEKSLSSFSTTQYTKFSRSDLNKNITIKHNPDLSHLIPYKRLTAPLMNNFKTINTVKSDCGKTENKLKELKKYKSLINSEKFKNRNEFLQHSINKIEWEKLSYSQLKNYLEDYIKEILNLDDERLNELIYRKIEPSLISNMLKDIENKVTELNLEDKLKGMYNYHDQQRQNIISSIKELDKIINTLNFTFMRKINKSIKYS